MSSPDLGVDEDTSEEQQEVAPEDLTEEEVLEQECSRAEEGARDGGAVGKGREGRSGPREMRTEGVHRSSSDLNELLKTSGSMGPNTKGCSLTERRVPGASSAYQQSCDGKRTKPASGHVDVSGKSAATSRTAPGGSFRGGSGRRRCCHRR